jgi:hypothetical protein
MRMRYLAALFTTILLLLGLSIGAQAQTTDGLTPAVEDICTRWGWPACINWSRFTVSLRSFMVHG